MKVRVPKPRRTFLEMDGLAALLDAAEDQDRAPAVPVPTEGGDRVSPRWPPPHGTAFDALVRRARSDGGDDEVSPA